MALSHLLLRRLKCSKLPFSITLLFRIPKQVGFSSLSASADSAHQSSPTPKPTSLSARMSFLFEQMDEINKKSEEKDETLQRIRSWRESKKQKDGPSSDPAPEPLVGDSMDVLKSELEKSEVFLGNSDTKKEVELVHPWPEWIELMERLLQQNYFDQRRKDEDRMMEGLGFDVSESNVKDDKPPDFARDFRTVQAAMVNFGRDRFDILRSLSRQDLQILVGYGCASADRKVVYSYKLLRKHVHLDEGDVCSSCSLRGSCEKAYLLTNKEDEARTIDVMRILLDYGFDPVDGSIANKSVLKNKSVKTVVRKLLHEVVKLSAVPIDPNLPPPVIKRPPPKVKQPPPPPKKRVGRNDIEMKKGDWLCQKCDFMNFAKNTVCLQCDAKRPKRQLLPGEWECPECNFLNYRRNTVCFHCEHKRPPDTYAESQFSERQRGPFDRTEKPPSRRDISDAWNFDFDDNESDGADVAAFEYADSQKLDDDFPASNQTLRENSRGNEDGFDRNNRRPKGLEKEYPDSSSTRLSTGLNDFDEEDDDDDIDSYELVPQNEMARTSRIGFSDLENDTESDDVEGTDDNWHARRKTKSPRNSRKQMNRKTLADSEDGEVDFNTDDDLPIHPNWKSSHVANPKQQKRGRGALSFGSDNDFGSSSGSDDEMIRSKNRGDRRGSYGMNRGREGRRNYRGSFSEGDSDDDTMVSKSRGNRRGSGGMGRGRGRSNYNASFSEGDFDDESIRSKNRGHGRDSNGMNRGRGGRSNFQSSFSKRDSYDEMRGGRRSSNRMESGRGGRSTFKASFSDRDSDDDQSYGDRKRDKGGRNGERKASRGGMTAGKTSFQKSDFDRRSKNGRENSSKNRSHKQGGTFDKRGGRSNSFESRSASYEADERPLRPRNNVR